MTAHLWEKAPFHVCYRVMNESCALMKYIAPDNSVDDFNITLHLFHHQLFASLGKVVFLQEEKVVKEGCCAPVPASTHPDSGS